MHVKVEVFNSWLGLTTKWNRIHENKRKKFFPETIVVRKSDLSVIKQVSFQKKRRVVIYNLQHLTLFIYNEIVNKIVVFAVLVVS